MKKNYGFIPDVIDPSKHWVLGGAQTKMKGTVLNPTANWIPYVPAGEAQSSGAFDAEDCTTMGTQNSIEALAGLLGYKVNYSKRALAIASGTTPQGNSPHTVAETIRTVLGELDEAQLPFDPTAQVWTWASYYSPNPLTKAMLTLGQKFWQQWDFSHEWVLDGTEDLAIQATKLKLALQSSPVGIGVFAWEMGPNNLYIRNGNEDCHWVSLVNYKDGEYWEIFDSYDGFLKQLDWNFGFTQAKRYALVPHQVTLSRFAQILQLIAQILHIDSLIVKQLPPAAGPIVTTPPATVPVNGAAVHPKIAAWAHAIAKAEGGNEAYPSLKTLNPGNLRYTPYTKSLGATGHTPTLNFAIFPNAVTALGLEWNDTLTGTGLAQFLLDAANNKLIPYKKARTLKAFTLIYAQPKLVNGRYPYIDSICADLKVEDSIDISTLV